MPRRVPRACARQLGARVPVPEHVLELALVVVVAVGGWIIHAAHVNHHIKVLRGWGRGGQEARKPRACGRAGCCPPCTPSGPRGPATSRWPHPGTARSGAAGSSPAPRRGGTCRCGSQCAEAWASSCSGQCAHTGCGRACTTRMAGGNAAAAAWQACTALLHVCAGPAACGQPPWGLEPRRGAAFTPLPASCWMRGAPVACITAAASASRPTACTWRCAGSAAHGGPRPCWQSE